MDRTKIQLKVEIIQEVEEFSYLGSTSYERNFREIMSRINHAKSLFNKNKNLPVTLKTISLWVRKNQLQTYTCIYMEHHEIESLMIRKRGKKTLLAFFDTFMVFGHF